MKFSLPLIFLACAHFVTAQETEDPGIEGWNEVCGTFIGTKNCTNTVLSCCYLWSDYGVCRVKCPEFGSVIPEPEPIPPEYEDPEP
ncbi:hypothetical protein CPB83DRAFT_906881 [Crepidotus variabilis]|uniref:Uncharacterized protein n=1 Tax=Crepidotus variabilis TaxID=179855 RepID=A0A9P6EFY6_9AGAR|nr:hypothetical protein CPB83DRAFT_906881 [Crepidotus variabilis]